MSCPVQTALILSHYLILYALIPLILLLVSNKSLPPASTVKSASELIHPSGFGYNLLSEAVPPAPLSPEPPTPPFSPSKSLSLSTLDIPEITTAKLQPLNVFPLSPGSMKFSGRSSTSSSSRTSACSPFLSLSIPEDEELDLESIVTTPSPSKKSYATVLTSGSPLTDSIPRMIFGDHPNTGFGAKKMPSKSSSSRPQLVRKGHVEEEIHNPAVISPVFFGKKKNIQRPRREVVFDESLVVWQRRFDIYPI